MKKIKWATPNRMKFDSSHKTFNRQVTCISTGNVLGGTQTSGYVRARNDLECNGFINPLGHLQEWDLTKGFLQNFQPFVKSYIRKNVIDKSVIAYEFYHYNGNEKIVDGYVITAGHSDGHKLLKKWYVNNTVKGKSIIDEAIKYITN